ncbi:MAG: caspase family protein [Deltaproteobacteria bacterium]|nr:caspase family protein [Deltaproteobacteria bacterium]
MRCLWLKPAVIVAIFFNASLAHGVPGGSVPTYALFIGSKQPGAAQAPLQYAHDDADRLRSVLEDLGGFRSENLKTLYDPTADQLSGALDRLETQLSIHDRNDEQAVFLFYYSGHARSQALNLGREEIPLNLLRSRLEKLPATVKLIILDACQTGAFSRIKGAEPTALFSYNSVMGLNTEGMVVISSSSATELSQESDELGGSFFTHHLVVGLRGAADTNTDGRITLNEVYQYAYNNTLVDTTETAVGKQHVTLETDLRGKGEMVITWPAQSNSSIRFPIDLAAEILIFTEPENVIMAEVHKTRGNALSIALPMRQYGALVRSGESTRYCEIAQDTAAMTLSFGACRDVQPNRIQFKGSKSAATDARVLSETAEAESAPASKRREAAKGPKTFYVNLAAGVGTGYFDKKEWIKWPNYGIDPEDSPGAAVAPPRGAIAEDKYQIPGVAWSGIPIRLAVGFFVAPKLSVEISGRFDVWVTSRQEPISCYEKNGGTLEGIDQISCNVDLPIEGKGYSEAEQEEIARKAFAVGDASDSSGMRKEYQVPWLINARLRYHVVARRSMTFSLFAGLGYGHIQYKIPDSADINSYYPMVGMVNVEVGPTIGFYFSDHFGIIIETPVDIVFGDGFSLNTDAVVGFSSGF